MRLIVVLGLCILVYSCSKRTISTKSVPSTADSVKTVPGDTVKQIDTACTLPRPLHESGYRYETQARFLYGEPYFNPNNSNEIIFLMADHESGTTSIIKYNLITNSKTTIANADVWGGLCWSLKGWILYTDAIGVWKVKDNGGSAILMEANAFDGLWDHAGDRFCFNTMSSNMFTFIADENGKKVDSLHYPSLIHIGAWSPDNSKIASPLSSSDQSIKGGVGYVDLTTKQVHIISNDSNSRDGTAGMSWFPDGQNLIWCSTYGMFKTNMTTGQTVQLRPRCGRKQYQYPSVSADGTKIIAERSDTRAVADTFYREINLFIMDADGSNERKVEIN